MKKVQFTNHAIMKIKLLDEHGMHVDLEFIKETLYNPEKRVHGYGEREIAQRTLDMEHLLRVVYEEQSDEFVVITVYPARRERYGAD